MQIKEWFLRNKMLFAFSAVLSVPAALLLSVIFYTLRSKPYSFPDLLSSIILLFCLLFWVFWRVLIKSKQILITFFKNLLTTRKNKTSTRTDILPIIFLIILAGLALTITLPFFDTLRKPNFKYSIEIIPDQESTGDICILEIRNSRGNVFQYNETALNAQNSGSWKRDYSGCDHYLERGGYGIISFNNIGPIDEEIEILVRSGPNSGSFIFKTRQNIEIAYDLRTDENQVLQLIISPFNMVFGKYANLPLRIGYISILLVISFLISRCFSLKQIDIGKISQAKHKLISGFYKIWLLIDTKQATLGFIFFIFISTVLFSIFVINPLSIGPTHYTDETRYWDTALSIYNGTFSTIKFYRSPPFYPISLLPAFYLFYPFGSYLFSKLLNAVYITSAIIPAYLLLRKFAKRNISIVAISLLILNPVQLIMPGRILSENIFYPIFMWTVLFAFTNVFPINQKNKVFESLILGVLLGLLFLTRYIALVLIPAFLLIWWLKPFENEKPTLLFSIKKSMFLILVLVPLILIMAGWITAGTAQGLRVKDMVGLFIAESPNPDQLSLSRLIMWTVFYCSYTILIAAPYLPVFMAHFQHFKLRDWKDDKNRWLITVGIIVFFLLVTCIRHSWRINYNYPIPIKIQGRYLLYFGPLFLITFFTLLQNPFKYLNPLKLIIYSSLMILVSYATLFWGFFYLGKPLTISASSPDGELVSVMGNSYIIFILANVIFCSLMINRKRVALFAFMVTFLFGFFIYGNVKIYQKISNLNYQSINSQVFHLIQEYKSLAPVNNKTNQESLNIFYPENSEELKVNLWRLTLDFNGFTDVELIESNILENDSAIILQARDSNFSLTLRGLTEKEFLISNKKKYSQSGKFFEFQ